MLFLDCLLELSADEKGNNPLTESTYGEIYRCLFIVSATLLLTVLNYRGLDIVGSVSIAICLFSLSPFLIFCVVGAMSGKVILDFKCLNSMLQCINIMYIYTLILLMPSL